MTTTRPPTVFDRAAFGAVDLAAPCLDPAGQPYWVDDHNQPLTWADAFDLWESQAQAAHHEPPRPPRTDDEPPY